MYTHVHTHPDKWWVAAGCLSLWKLQYAQYQPHSEVQEALAQRHLSPTPSDVGPHPAVTQGQCQGHWVHCSIHLLAMPWSDTGKFFVQSSHPGDKDVRRDHANQSTRHTQCYISHTGIHGIPMSTLAGQWVQKWPHYATKHTHNYTQPHLLMVYEKLSQNVVRVGCLLQVLHLYLAVRLFLLHRWPVACTHILCTNTHTV